MRIGIIADTHGNLVGWQRAVELFGAVDLIVHCGDVLYHGPKFDPVEGYAPRELAAAINAMPVPVLIARGNGDSDVDQLVLEVPLHSPYLFAQVEGLRLLAGHGHIQPPEELAALARKWGVHLLLTGHSHVPSFSHQEALIHVNPGTVTYPLAADEALARRTCAVWTDGSVIHYDLSDGSRLNL
ncbi:MAG: phosphodiesterase [Armatimonadota bacterium]